ncbi:MAG: hypothetical protein H0T85_07330 [Geodermatophilaceae bacterium]|nr:hypothetical protein [Geodermatophilaceae bacterium]
MTTDPTQGETETAGADLSDDELIDEVAKQTDSASPNADTAGKDWNGETEAPDPSA